MNEKDCLMLKYISETKNLTKVAERLYITPPALTYRIQQLERDYSIPILIRSGRNIDLTTEGEYLVEHAKKVLKESKKTREHLLNMSNEVQGMLKIGVSRVISYYKLPYILKSFIEKYPKVEIIVDSGLSTEMYQLLKQEEVHICVIRGGYRWWEQKHMLMEEKVCIISNEKINIDQLPKLPLINYKIESNFSENIKSWWNERFDEPPRITMQADSYETCKEMVKSGLGYSIIPGIFLDRNDHLFTEHLESKDGQVMTVQTWMLYRESSSELKVVKSFIEHIKSLNINFW